MTYHLHYVANVSSYTGTLVRHKRYNSPFEPAYSNKCQPQIAPFMAGLKHAEYGTSIYKHMPWGDGLFVKDESNKHAGDAAMPSVRSKG